MIDNFKIIDKFFYNKKIRTVWDSESEMYYISAVDISGALSDSTEPRKYWNWLKNKVKKEEGFELSSITRQLKLQSSDGKYYKTEVVSIEGMFRIIESIPSKNAEPVKNWLAKLGKERIDEEYDPSIAINRALNTYKKKGYSDNWINQRIKSIDIRKEFTDELIINGVESNEDFAKITNMLTEIWSGYSIKKLKKLKSLKKESLRDNMTNTEAVLNMLAEVSTAEIAKASNEYGKNNILKSVIKGGNIAKLAKEQIENETGNNIVTNKNNILKNYNKKF